MAVSFNISGSFTKTEAWLRKLQKLNAHILSVMKKQGSIGAQALAAATPRDSGLAAGSWGYTVTGGSGRYILTWTNVDIESGFPVAIMLQYGYGTGTGGYVQGQDYINPVVKPIFDQIANEVWKAVTSA